jgi:Mrp family chromosome partitioning ATPase
LEVDSLSWPIACVDLLDRASARWDRFAEHLTDRSSEDNKTVMIVSCRRGEGRTTIALATARHMAARGLRCVVVDADFENPTLAAHCGVSPQMGWGEVIDGDLPFGEALIAGVNDNVTVMPWQGPAGRLAQSSAALRATTGFRLLREHYDLVIIDAMPLGGMSAEAELASLAKATGPCGVYLVRDVRATQPQQMAAACARLGRMSIKVTGVIENFFDPSGTSHTLLREEQ